MNDEALARINTAAESGGAEAAIDVLLELAAQDPLDPDLHVALTAACPPSVPPSSPPLERLSEGYAGISDWLTADKSDRARLLANLPELGSVDDARFPAAVDEARFWMRRNEEWTSLSVPSRLAHAMPLVLPRRNNTYHWEEPDVTLREGVLFLRQLSRYYDPDGETHTEDVRFAAYRVKGVLYHARYVRFGYWRD